MVARHCASRRALRFELSSPERGEAFARWTGKHGAVVGDVELDLQRCLHVVRASDAQGLSQTVAAMLAAPLQLQADGINQHISAQLAAALAGAMGRQQLARLRSLELRVHNWPCGEIDGARAAALTAAPVTQGRPAAAPLLALTLTHLSLQWCTLRASELRQLSALRRLVSVELEFVDDQREFAKFLHLLEGCWLEDESVALLCRRLTRLQHLDVSINRG